MITVESNYSVTGPQGPRQQHQYQWKLKHGMFYILLQYNVWVTVNIWSEQSNNKIKNCKRGSSLWPHLGHGNYFLIPVGEMFHLKFPWSKQYLKETIDPCCFSPLTSTDLIRKTHSGQLIAKCTVVRIYLTIWHRLRMCSIVGVGIFSHAHIKWSKLLVHD